ncbi:GntP family transporter [Pseudarthrobacter sp. J75]|uniref:GntP family transporter n=1 Tax=unclassified Pseudarthrobacter TaxID=2647000 RepID=UPI002E81EC71|nr:MULTISPECIES: GntP family transporter [unclassified Pseudarthrobacter]MEE2521888.1 GntP family transporter [Pseudarthrobacter sp. J47]MEE2528813.1 GntP family transporter [Pseudarthrobacter sp. J75]
MSALALLAIAAAGVALLLVAVIKFKIPAFLALLVVSVSVALVAGIPLPDVIKTVTEGMGGTLGSVAILVGLGAMLGKMIEISGGAQALAGKFTQLLGPRRVIAALTAAAFLLAIPVFFDVGFIILIPIIYGFAKAAGVNPVKIGLPVGAIMLAIHVVVPPHPGVVGGAGILGADIGWATILGLALCIPVGVLGYFLARKLNRRDFTMLPATAEQFRLFGSGTSQVEKEAGHGGVAVKTEVKTAPSPAMIITLIVLPILMIMVGTVGAVILPKDSFPAQLAAFVGAPLIALLTALGLAYYFLGIRRGWSSQHTGEVMDSALAPTAIVILVTGAGGVFGKVLTVSGIGKALAEGLQSVGLPVIVMAFILAAVLRASQGSATVAIITTSGLLAASVADGGFSPLQTALILVAIGFGAFGLSHVNDSGFWIVTRYLGLSVADGLRTWTVLTTALGLAGFALTFLVWVLAGGLSV